MQFFEDMKAEHDLIEQVAGALRTFAAARVRGEGTAADGRRFMLFFRLFAGAFHHLREEQILFPALIQRVSLPGDRGPIAVILREHREMAALLDEMEPLIDSASPTPAEVGRLADLADRYTAALWRHIDAENSVLFPESEVRLRRYVRDLECRPLTAAEADARAAGGSLVRMYPPDPGAMPMRGEGCVSCHAYGDTCDGLEREWWTELEWEEFQERLGSD